eukprot:scaffold33516_cov111-Skeletonema_dohrnii-CCMP3373.AAC.2
MRRVEKNDPVAIREIGMKHGNNGDYELAFEYLTKAAELGDALAHYLLSLFYRDGQGVEKDEKKGFYYLEEAAIAAKHFIIAANLGHDDSIQALKECYKRGGLVSKEDFAAALRAHQAAVDATKSPQRDAAEALKKFRASQQQTVGRNA